MGFENNAPRHQEEGGFGAGMGPHVEQGTQKPLGAQGEKTNQNVGKVADGGVCQPLFQHLFVVSHHTSHENRHQCQGNPGVLHPGARKKLGSHRIVDHTDHGNDTRLGNNTRKQGAGAGGCHRVGGGQPVMHGEHTGFGGKAHHSQEHHHKEEVFVVPQGSGIHRSPQDEIMGGGIKVNGKQPQKAQEGASHRIEEIFQGGGNGLLGLGVEHHGHGSQGGKLEEQVEGHKVPGEADPQKAPQRQEQEGEKAVVIPLVGDVAEGVNRNQDPGRQHQNGKEATDAVGKQGQIQPLAKGGKGEGLAGQHAPRRRKGGQDQGPHDVGHPLGGFINFQKGQQCPGHQGNQNGKKIQHNAILSLVDDCGFIGNGANPFRSVR